MLKHTIEPIGIIETPFKQKEDCPIQGIIKPDTIGIIKIFKKYEEALLDIETFSHLTLLYLFDRADDIKLSRPTFLDDNPHGVFASRHPCRPNSIGMTTVKLLRRKDNVLEVSGIDVLDGTPLIDIKPYIPKFDRFPDANNGWIDGKEFCPKPEGRE